MLKVQNEGQAVISLISTLSAKHWREYVEEQWDTLTQGITGTIRLMILAGVHGSPKGKVGPDAKNIKDCNKQAVIFLSQSCLFVCLFEIHRHSLKTSFPSISKAEAKDYSIDFYIFPEVH